MKNKYALGVVSCLLLLVCGIFSSRSVNAANFGFVAPTSPCDAGYGEAVYESQLAAYDNGFFDCAWVLGYYDDYVGETKFAINLHASGRCLYTTCEQVGGQFYSGGYDRHDNYIGRSYYYNFECATPGGWYLKYINNSKTRVTYSYSDSQWDYYVITFMPADYTFSSNKVQSVKGMIRIKKTFSVSVVAREDDGYLNTISGQQSSYQVIDSNILSRTVENGQSVALNVSEVNFSGYSWGKWGQGSGQVCAAAGDSKTCVINNVTTNINNIQAYYVRNRFNGRAGVKGEEGSSEDTGWVGKTLNDGTLEATKTITMSGCEENGCETKFNFSLQRAAGEGTTTTRIMKYERGKEQNDYTVTNVDNVSWNGNSEQVAQYIERVKPGEGVCYEMEFDTIAAVELPTYKSAEKGKVKVCAEAEEPVDTGFEGKIDVSGSVIGSTEYSKLEKDVTYVIKSCSATDGCVINFEHSLKGTSGFVEYSVARSSNFAPKIPNNNNSGKYYVGNSNNIYSDTNLRLYPGVKICESLTFSPNTGENPISLTACVVAEGEAGSSLDLTARRGSSEGWSNGPIYAKPGDKIAVKGRFERNYLYATNLTVDRIFVNGERRDNDSSTSLSSLYSNIVNPGWNSNFSIDVADNRDSSRLPFGNKVPSASFARVAIGEYSGNQAYSVAASDVGIEGLRARARTNGIASTKTTPQSLSFVHNNGNVEASVNISPLEKDVEILVPYNFKNRTCILEGNDCVKNSTSNKRVLYAGETTNNISFKIDTETKMNTLIGEEYATIVRDASWMVRMCYDNNGTNTCVDSNVKTGVNLNDGNGSLQGSSRTISGEVQLDVPDLPAGTKVTVKSLVSPKNSGSDENISIGGYDNDWAESEEVEYIIAKRPSFQVWGGDIKITDGSNSKLTQAKKTTLAEYNLNGETAVFGSWGELGVIGGDRELVGSGAILGYRKNEGGVLWPNPIGPSLKDGDNLPGGSTLDNTYGSLLFLNSTSTAATISSNYSSSYTDSATASARFAPVIDTFREHVNMEKPIEEDSSGIKESTQSAPSYQSEDGILRLYENPDDALVISSNIVSDGDYQRLDTVKKTIIYAKNINIACDVTEIDALLIAEENIDTCYDGKKSSDYVRQLRINGVVIAGENLLLKRNYGAGTGVNSMVSAEIINMDPTWYLWLADIATGGSSVNPAPSNSDSLVIPTYMRDLAPRY